MKPGPDGAVPPISRFRKARGILRDATRPSVVRAAVRISLVVGTLLNAVNLGPRLVHGVDISTLLRLVANYLVPYCVATIGAVSQTREREVDAERSTSQG